MCTSEPKSRSPPRRSAGSARSTPSRRASAAVRPSERVAVRQAETKPLMTALWSWLMERLEEISAKSSLATAIRYTLGHWEGLTLFLADGRVEVDNNTVERVHPSDSAWTKERAVRRIAPRRRAMGGPRVAHQHGQAARDRSPDLPGRCARPDRLRPHQGQCAARVAAVELEGGACGAARRRGVTKQRTRRSRSTGPAMSLEQLDAWLHTLEPPPRVDGASMLDGYLTAIVIGPCSIPPDEWFIDLLGERGRIATAAGDVLAAIKAIVARFNVISEGLSIAPKQHAPIFEKTDDGLALPQSVVHGLSQRDAAAL